jgi:hypothetical protein
MINLLMRFLIGGTVVSLFAVLGDILRYWDRGEPLGEAKVN